MRSIASVASLMCCLFLATACFNGNEVIVPETSELGSLSMSFNLEGLILNSTPGASRAMTISAVSVTLSKDGYDDIVENLTVSSNVATGTISDLAVGYWHVDAEVFDAGTLVTTGTADVNIIAGSTTNCEILFDPIVTVPTTGNLDITVGVNPLPGYKALGLSISAFLYSNDNIYISDSSSNIIAVFDEQMVRVKDIVLQQAPTAIALNFAKDAIFLGYSNGSIYSLDPATETTTFVCDAMMAINKMVAVNESFLLIGGSSSSGLKTVDITTAQIVGTKSTSYTLYGFELNADLCTVYTHSVGISPSDIYKIRIDPASGAITTFDDSSYHGDYSMGYPLRVIKDETRVVAKSGNVFTCSSVEADDLVYTGSIGYAFIDLKADDVQDKYYLLNTTSPYKLVILSSANDFVTQTFDLAGTPEYLVVTDNYITVFTKNSGKYFTKSIPKTDLL